MGSRNRSHRDRLRHAPRRRTPPHHRRAAGIPKIHHVRHFKALRPRRTHHRHELQSRQCRPGTRLYFAHVFEQLQPHRHPPHDTDSRIHQGYVTDKDDWLQAIQESRHPSDKSTTTRSRSPLRIRHRIQRHRPHPKNHLPRKALGQRTPLQSPRSRSMSPRTHRPSSSHVHHPAHIRIPDELPGQKQHVGALGAGHRQRLRTNCNRRPPSKKSSCHIAHARRCCRTILPRCGAPQQVRELAQESAKTLLGRPSAHRHPILPQQRHDARAA